MALNMLRGVPAPGTLTIVFIPADEVPNLGALTLAAAKGTTAVSVGCHMPAGWSGVTGTTTGKQHRRACSIEEYTVSGPVSRTIGNVSLAYDPQDLTGDLSAPYVALVEGSEWVMLDRRGVDGRTDLASGDVVDLYRVRVDVVNKPWDDSDGSEVLSELTLSYLGEYRRDYVLPAA